MNNLIGSTVFIATNLHCESLHEKFLFMKWFAVIRRSGQNHHSFRIWTEVHRLVMPGLNRSPAENIFTVVAPSF